MVKLMMLILRVAGGLSLTSISQAMTTDELMQSVSVHVVKIQVGLNNGGYGLGSGVVIAKDQVVTNCHVIANATSVSVRANDENFTASAVKPDWHHDLCILTVAGLKVPIAKIGASEQLKYEQKVYTVGFANASPRPNGTTGYVKGLYPMDDSVIVRASNTFRLGDSGGGMFDEAGQLVGIITVKSPGHNAFYYNMPVEWVQRLLGSPEQILGSKSSLPFWAEAPEHWPFFMQIVHPLKTENWQELHRIALKWFAQEPNNSEALFYRAVAEYSLNDRMNAEKHFNQVIAQNSQNSSALYYLGRIAEENGKRIEALNMVALLNDLDQTTASELKVAIGLPD
jgi:serine protease Do